MDLQVPAAEGGAPSPATVTATATATAGRGTDGSAVTVLVVDEESVGLTVRAALEAEGYQVELATDLREALSRIERASFDVLLLELQLGESDALVVLKRLRERSPGAIGIILTGRATLEHAVQAMRIGADDFLVKPSGLAELKASVSRALQRRAQAEERIRQVIREQTARAEAEAARAAADAARRHLQQLFLQAPAMIAVTRGPEHNVELINPRCLRAMGRRDPGELLGRPLPAAFRTALPQGEPALAGQGLFERLDEVYASGEPHVGRETPARIYRGAGRSKDALVDGYFDLVLQPLRTIQGAVDGVFVFAVDVTDYVRARGRAAELDRLKEEFIQTASHDLKSPLTSIRGHSQLLLRRMRAASPDITQLAQGLAVIDAQTAEMTRLLDDLLDASRLQGGRLQLRTAPCDVGECLDTVLARLSPQEQARIDLALPDAPLAGEWERKRIEQVLANLVGNALKYSPESERVGIAVARRAGEIEVAVRDRGLGIPPEELPRLFERFHRTPQALASGLSGTGLGLYISQGIVAAHGGRIWAESPGVGQGSTFRFTLPVTPSAPSVRPERGGRPNEGPRTNGKSTKRAG